MKTLVPVLEAKNNLAYKSSNIGLVRWKDCYNVGSFLVQLFLKDFAVIAFGWLVGWLGFVITRWMHNDNHAYEKRRRVIDEWK